MVICQNLLRGLIYFLKIALHVGSNFSFTYSSNTYWEPVSSGCLGYSSYGTKTLPAHEAYILVGGDNQ